MASTVNQHCANCIGTLSSELRVVGTNPFLFWGHLVLCCLLNCQLPTVKMASSFITVCSHCCSGANSVSTLDSIRKPFNNNTHTQRPSELNGRKRSDVLKVYVVMCRRAHGDTCSNNRTVQRYLNISNYKASPLTLLPSSVFTVLDRPYSL